MGKKKRREDAGGERRVYCYYCERVFEDEKVLIQHQKARHFKCHICHKKLSTSSGMVIHLMQVHKEQITCVPNAKPNRDSLDLEIYGMEGVPGEVSVYSDASKKPRIDVPGMGMPGMPMGMLPPPMGFAPRPMFAGARPPPPGVPMTGPPPRPPFGGVPPHLSAAIGFPPRMPGVPPGIPGAMGAPGQPPIAPPPWAGMVPPGMVPPRPAMGVPPMLGPPGAVAMPSGVFPGVPGAVPVPAAIGAAVSAGDAVVTTQRVDGLVFYDEHESMEEKRALRPKYGYKPMETATTASASAQ